MKFIKNVRENLKNPKKKSLTLLGIYFVFFIIVFVLLSSAPTNEPIKNIEEPKKDVVTSYEYIYNLSDINNSIEIKGTHKDTEDLFTYNGLKYYKKNNILYSYQNNELKEIPSLNINIDNYNYDSIKKMIDSSVLIDETTYNDNSSKINYEINIDDYLNFLNIEKTNLDITIPIIVSSSDYINEVSIDLTNYYKYQFLIKINYNNINKIDNIKVGTN